MADTALEGFHWFAELDYNVAWFTAERFTEFRRMIGMIHSFPDNDHRAKVSNFLEAALEHANELTMTLRHLKEIADHG